MLCKIPSVSSGRGRRLAARSNTDSPHRYQGDEALRHHRCPIRRALAAFAPTGRGKHAPPCIDRASERRNTHCSCHYHYLASLCCSFLLAAMSVGCAGGRASGAGESGDGMGGTRVNAWELYDARTGAWWCGSIADPPSRILLLPGTGAAHGTCALS
eukprot:COSAG05_NODE_112_length_18489_cov_15.556281_9_plen_157_part_00